MRREKAGINFFRKNAAYIVLALCIVAIGLSITFVMLDRSNGIRTEEANRASIDDNTGDKTQTGDTETPDTSETTEPTVDPVDPEPETPVSSVISFILPVENFTAISDYTDTLKFNATLKRYEAHKAIDFYAEEGTPVFAAYGGTVSDIETTLLTGTTVTIDHGNGLFTVYNSLADGDDVFVGQTVLQGAEIGEVSVTNRQESSGGAHLHFQVIENGAAIDPAKYLSVQDK